MKKIIVYIISLFVLTAAFGQPIPGDPPGFLRIQIPASETVPYDGIGANTAIAFWLYLPTAHPRINGVINSNAKIPSQWFYHGIGERTTSTANSAKGDINELPKMLLSGHLPYYFSQEGANFLANRRFAAPGKTDSFPYAMIAPQCWGGYSWFYKFYTYNLLRWIKQKVREGDSRFERLDTTRFHAVGLSFGGGHVSLIGHDTILRPQFATGRGICSGYGSIPNRPYNWKNAGEWPTWWEHAKNDVAPPSGQVVDTTDKIVRLINANNPLFPPIYLRWDNGGHGIWPRGFAWANRVNIYLQSNGNNFTYGHGYHAWQLQYTTVNTRRPKNRL